MLTYTLLEEYVCSLNALIIVFAAAAAFGKMRIYGGKVNDVLGSFL